MSNNSKNSTVMKASKKNNQAVEVNNNAVAQPLTERQSLRALCKQLREKYGTEERINNLLCIYYKELHNLPILKTREQWERESEYSITISLVSPLGASRLAVRTKKQVNNTPSSQSPTFTFRKQFVKHKCRKPLASNGGWQSPLKRMAL